MVMDRLVFGCGRLTGGASEREALRLVGQCLDAGVRIFDTAPSYGIGTAEAVVGKALHGRSDCVIVTKLGSRVPDKAWLKTLARRVKRTLQGTPARGGDTFEPVRVLGPNSGCRWEEGHLRASLERSLKLLGRIDRLYLHDPYLPLIDAGVIELVGTLAHQVGAAAGYATAAVWSGEEDAIYPQGWRAQAAIVPEWLVGAAPATRGDLTLHSLAMSGDWLARQDAGFAAGMEQAARIAGNRVAAVVALAAVRVPQAELVIASADSARLGQLLGSLKALDDTRLAEIAACF